MEKEERGDLINMVELAEGKREDILKKLGIPRSTYYKWRDAYEEGGIEALKKGKANARRLWNRLSPIEIERIVEIAKLHPELSCRLLAVKITDNEDFSISESTVYRILKERNLISPRPLLEMPAAKQWKEKTT